MNKLVYIVDDEEDILELVALHLTKAGFKINKFPKAGSFLNAVKRQLPDMIILDLMLPDADGLEICKYLKKEDKFSEIPVIMLTAKAEETEKVIGLELGADDYVTKPFSPKELVARVKSVLRRKERKESTKKREVGDMLLLDLEKYEVFVEGRKVQLTVTEFKILELLSQSKGLVYTRDKILDHLWGIDKAVLDRTIDVHIRNIREKLGKAGGCIKSVRGVGYKMDI